MEDYPREVRTSPLPLVALVGATHLHAQLVEALHEGAMAMVQQKRMRYLSFDYDYQIPPCKRGGKDSPSYIPEGILKRRWLRKVCDELPAVVVVCFDWLSDAGETALPEALARVQHAQRQVHNRDIRLLVFVALCPKATDPEHQCQALRQAQDVSGFVSARGLADLATKAQKLERMVHQYAMAFYADEEKRHRRVQTPRPSAPAWIRAALQARASLKTGFTCEFRRDTRAALKSYIEAYEQLVHDAEIADIVERMALCNHITLRMYQLYLQSHDISAAVHHCRIHTATLRSCCTNEPALAWRRWHWLASNHQVVAELLENMLAQLPLLVDRTDMWHFPGFHYQSSASYVGHLKGWARSAVEGDPPLLPEPSGTGGAHVAAPYVGQAEVLERPGECTDPRREVALRRGREEAFKALHADRGLQLLTRAQAACKERSYSAAITACSVRMADEFLSEGNFAAASKLYERLIQHPVETEPRGGVRPMWPAVRRRALERSILCSFRALGIRDVPALCCGAGAPPPVPAQKEAPDEMLLAAARVEARRRLPLDAFEYLSTVASADGVAIPTITPLPEEQQTELLHALFDVLRSGGAAEEGGNTGGDDGGRGATSSSALAPEEVPFPGAIANVEICTQAVGDPLELSVRLRSPSAAAIEISDAVAITSHGDVELSALLGVADDAPLCWKEGQDLELRGGWRTMPRRMALPQDVRVASIRLTLAGVQHVSLVIRDIRPPMRVSLLPPFRAPHRSSVSLEGGLIGGPPRTPAGAGMGGAPFRAEVFCPVEPSAALATEHFVFHMVVLAKRQMKHAHAPMRLSLAYSVRAQEAAADFPGNEAPVPPSVLRLLAGGEGVAACVVGGGGPATAEPPLTVDGAADGSANCHWVPLALDGAGEAAALTASAALAELRDGCLRPLGETFALTAEHLGDGPVRWSEDEEPLVVPLAAICDHPCKASVSLRLFWQEEGVDGEDEAEAASAGQVDIRFRSSLQVTFDDRKLNTTGPGGTEPCTVRRLLLKSLAPAPLVLSSVSITKPGAEAASGHPPQSVLGALGRLAPQASHVFALLRGHNETSTTSGSLVVRFARADADAVFFPWTTWRGDPRMAATVRGSLAKPCVAGLTLPEELSPPSQPASPGAQSAADAAQASASGDAVPVPPPAPPLRVDLEHSSTGTVAEPLVVKVKVGRTSCHAGGLQEIRVFIGLGSEADGGKGAAAASERYFLHGPTHSQAILASSEKLQPQVCSSFTILPLRPGWLAVPRVQVSVGGQEAASAPASIFIFPSGQPVLLRNGF